MRTKLAILFAVLLLTLCIHACNFPLFTNETQPSSNEQAGNISTSQTMTSLKLTLVTGEDGTNDNPVLGLFDIQGNTLFTATLDSPGDLQPDQTDIYEFTVPITFCQAAGWSMNKPPTEGVDDPWILNEIYIEMDGVTVYFDRGVALSFDTISSESNLSGNWAGIDVYIQQCEN